MTGERILLVEDSAQVRQFLAETVLPAEGYDVLTARDGEEGLILARDLVPDIIIADYLMPNRTGLELLAALRAESVDLPFILITAEGSEALAVEALRLGVSDYLIKPFEPDDLLDAIERVLRDHWTRRITEHVPVQLLEANRELERRVQEFDTLVQIGKRVTAHLDLDSILNDVLDAAVALAHTEEGSLLLVDPETDDLYLFASTDPSDTGSFRLPVSDSLAGQVVQTGQPLVITGTDLRKIKTHYLVHDVAYLPLMLHQRVIGVLGVANRGETSGAFAPHTLQLLSVLSDFAAIAIENARLYGSAEDERHTLDAVLHDTEDVIIIADKHNTILYANPSACRTFAIDASLCQGYPLEQVLNHEEVLELFAKSTRPGRMRASEISLDVGQRILNAHLNEVEGVGKVVVMQDITHLKELDRVKSDFVTTVSHDLRSPLTAILGYVELLSRSGPLNENQQQFIERIIFSVQSITSLITDLLELGKIEAGFDQAREPTALNLIVRYAIESQRHQWETKRQKLVINIQDNLPPILGNPLRLRQMINNLLENAIKYTPEGGEVGIMLEADSDFLVLQVTDSGMGIPQKDQPYIFDKFYRSDSAIDHYAGTGLGLSIVKGIIDQHNGRIWVESLENIGSAFTVMLPAYHGDAAD